MVEISLLTYINLLIGGNAFVCCVIKDRSFFIEILGTINLERRIQLKVAYFLIEILLKGNIKWVCICTLPPVIYQYSSLMSRHSLGIQDAL